MVDPDPITFLELLGSVIFKMAGIVNVNGTFDQNYITMRVSTVFRGLMTSIPAYDDLEVVEIVAYDRNDRENENVVEWEDESDDL